MTRSFSDINIRLNGALSPGAKSCGSVNVSVIDGNTNEVVKTIKVGGICPYLASVNSETNKIYVINNYDNTTSVIDGNLDTLLKTVKLVGKSGGLVVNPNTNKVYVTIPDYNTMLLYMQNLTK